MVVKAQVLVGGRGKAGGVKLAASPDEAEQRAREIIGLDIKGVRVRTVLVAPAVDIAKEFYLGLVLDRGAKAVTIIASAEGGIEIEETAVTNPEAILRHPIDPLWACRTTTCGAPRSSWACRPICGRRSHRSCEGCTTPSWEPMPTWPRSTRW